MSALLPTVEPSKLLHALNFTSKGLSHPTFLDYQPSEGKEARLLVRALYHGPRPGWPALDRDAIRAMACGAVTEDTTVGAATRSALNGEGRRIIEESRTGRATIPICLIETSPSYPVPVIVSIALANQPSACEAAVKNIHMLSQLYVNGYPPFQLPVATWRTAEGVWCIVKDEGCVKLRNWWEMHARPPMEESESRWRIWSWRRDSIPKKPSSEELVNGENLKEGTVTALAVQQRDDEQESMTVDRGWLQAVEILIQMADIILSLNERGLCLTVSSPDFFSVVPQQPYTPRSCMPSDPQPTSLELVHLSEAVRLPGYESGSYIGHVKTAQEREDSLRDRSPTDDGVADDAALNVGMDEATILRHLRFIAPEAISSRNTIGPATDIFSWGMAAADLINGKGGSGTLSTGGSEGQEFFSTVYTHSTRPLPPLSDFHPSMTPELAEVVQRAVSLDPESRYNSFSSLIYDLNHVKQICQGTLRGVARIQFTVGHIDQQSRFALPPGLMDREDEFAILEEAYQLVKSTGRSQVACCWGMSGSGKSKLLELWARQKESDNAGQDCFVGWAKMDQHLVKPLSAFISVFCSLLERVFSDPLESATVWRQRVLDSLAVNANIFLALLPKEWRAILLDGQESEEMGSDMTVGIDWESWVKQFRTWSYGLLRLFASQNRPLIIIVDDVQWLERSEKDLWDELITSSNRRLDHCLILFSYRTKTDAQPDMAPLFPKYMIQARPFNEETLGRLIVNSFHLGSVSSNLHEHWPRFVSALLTSTKGNPFDIKWKLSTMVRDGLIYYNFKHQKWEANAAVLAANTDFNAEEFASNMLNSLSTQARSVLCHLACLPSRGIEISLLASLMSRSENAIRLLLSECAALGSIIITNNRVQFVHDKPHAAVLASLGEDRKPRLFAAIGRALEGISTDYNFVQADMFLSAFYADPTLVSRLEVVRAAVRAARAAAVSGALDLASTYLDRTCVLWPYHQAQAWKEDSELALDFLTVTSEVALGLKEAMRPIENIESVIRYIPSLWNKLDSMIWLFRLELSAVGPEAALKTFFRALRLLDYGSPAHELRHLSMPEDATHILALLDAPEPPQTNQGRVAMSLADFLGIAGSTVYSFVDVDERFRILEFVIPILLQDHAATKHPASAYTWYLYAILLGNEDISRLKTASAWIQLADTYTVPGGPIEAAVETCRGVVGYITAQDLEKIDFTHAYQLCLASSNYDIVSYVLGLDLGTRALSGKAITKMFRSGQTSLRGVEEYLQPASRLMNVPFLQFAANLTDRASDSDKTNGMLSWSILEGEFVTPQDTSAIPSTPPLFVLVYGLSSLFLGLLFKVPSDELHKRALIVAENASGGTGTILLGFSYILLSITSLLTPGSADDEIVKTTHKWLDAFPHNHDFQAIRKMLIALDIIKGYCDGIPQGNEWIFVVEDAIDSLERAESYLFTGLLCTRMESVLRTQSGAARQRISFLHNARLAYQACEAGNLVRFIDDQIAVLAPPRLAQNLGFGKASLISSATEPGDDSPSLHSGPWGGEVPSSGNTTNSNTGSVLKTRALDLEKILRSFLILASERDSSGLIRRVLQVLLQVTCAHYACFAIQDATTGSSRLQAYGTSNDDIRICDKSFVEAKDIAPTILLSHAIMTKKPITEANVKSLENGNLVAREPFFAVGNPPRSFLLLPLFVQGRLSGVIYLSSNLSSSRLQTSQVGLLATFAAIILEANKSYKSLESAVKIRTQQLQQALHSRSAFISGVSHEIRTPLFAINGLCAVMQASSDLTEPQRENLHVISQSANDLQRIVTDVLDWSKLDAGSITPESIPFDLRRIIENALETVAHLARSKNITLLLENSVATDPSVSLKGDPHRYRQCLLNLLSNAIKFTPPSTRDHASTISISWSWQDRGDKVEITCVVKDEGIGIPAKSMHKLFQSFSQVDSGISRTFGGTGLGLSITRGLAKMQDGNCWAESVEGQGSTFYLLVLVDKDTSPETTVQSYRPSEPLQRALIYAAGTSATAVVQANLDSFGVQNTLCDRQSPHIQQLDRLDFVIIDVDDCPLSDETLLELRKRHSGSKFIMLVALADVDKIAGLVKEDILVTKPIKAHSLYNATRSCSDPNTRTAEKPLKKASGMDPSYVKMYPLKICYIDDSKVNVAVGKKILSKFGYKDVDVCYDGQQAVAAAQLKQYDLMLMDLQMPNMDGHTAKRLIAEDPNTGDPYIVALTANADQETKDRCMIEEHFQGFLSKPLTISALADTLKTAYNHSQTRLIAPPIEDLDNNTLATNTTNVEQVPLSNE